MSLILDAIKANTKRIMRINVVIPTQMSEKYIEKLLGSNIGTAAKIKCGRRSKKIHILKSRSFSALSRSA